MAAALQTPFGHSLPPEGPHTVTTHLPKWATSMRIRDGDMSIMPSLKSLYPRFMPFGPSRMLVVEVSRRLKLSDGRGLVGFLSPEVWQTNKKHATSLEFRKDKVVAESDMTYRVVEIAGIRLYLVDFPAAKSPGATFMWQHGGLGFSTRLGAHLLSQIDTFSDLGEFPDGLNAPEPTYLTETESHELLRKRIAGLLGRATVEQYARPVQSDDVYLYQSGMAAINRLHETIVRLRPDPVAVFGAVFHSSWHIFEESPGGLKHYGKCDENDLNEFEKYLEQGGKCSYVFTEFPSNPILVSVDLIRLRQLADKHGFWIVVDDTVGSFCNLDVLPVADIVLTSLSKSFSGYADLLAGSIALNPNRQSHEVLKPAFAESYHNEFFADDAAQLFKNSDDYLPRSAILNRNARIMTAYFQGLAQDPNVPISKVCYPPYSDGWKNLSPFLRKPSPDFPGVGYGCLFSVEMATYEQAVLFYDALGFHQGPHLGAHLTIAMPYNAMAYGKEHPEYHAAYGLSQNQVRFSAGLEDEATLLQVCKDAVAAMLKGETSSLGGGEIMSQIPDRDAPNGAETMPDADPLAAVV